MKPSTKTVELLYKNALKLTYEHRKFQKFSGGDTPGPPKFKGRGGEEGKGRGRVDPPCCF